MDAAIKTAQEVVAVGLDARGSGHLGQSGPFINADDVHGLGITGRCPSHRHSLAILRMTPDRAIDAPLVGARCAANHRAIYTIDRMLVELFREVAMSFVALGGDQHTRRSPIQAVHDSRSLHSANPGQVIAMVK